MDGEVSKSARFCSVSISRATVKNRRPAKMAAYHQRQQQPPPPPQAMPMNGVGGRQQHPSAGYAGHQCGQQQQRQQQMTIMSKSGQIPTPNVPHHSQSRQQSGGSNANANAATPVSALTLLQRKRRRYESPLSTPSSLSSSAVYSCISNANASSSNNCNDNTNAGSSTLGSSAPILLRLPPPLYLLLPPPPSKSNSGSSTNAGSRRLAAAANLSDPSAGTFEIGQGISEISGEAGSGKTQLCLRLCVSCALITYDVDGDAGEDVCGSGGVVGQQQRRQAVAMPPPPAANVRNPYANSSHQGVAPRPVPRHHHHHHHQQQQQQQYAQQAPRQHRQTGNRRQYYRAVYVTMGEGLNPSQIAYRLGQMATASTSMSASSASSTGTHGSTAVLSRILTRSVRNEDELLDLVRRELPAMLRRGWDEKSSEEGRIGLVVLDSIAGMFRLPDAAKDKGTAFFARRSEVLFGLSAQLRKLGDEYGVAVVVANQVTAGKAASGVGIGGGGPPRIMGGSGGGGNPIPALGLSWSNCINTRFVLRRSETLSSRLGVSSSSAGSGSGTSNTNGNQQHNQQAPAPASMFRRWARVAKSPVLPPVSVPFAIDVRGGVATEDPK